MRTLNYYKGTFDFSITVRSLSTNNFLIIVDEKDNEIEEEKRTMADLDVQIKEWEKKVRQQHKKMGGVHMSSGHTVQTQKTINTLENRLDQVRHSCL